MAKYFRIIFNVIFPILFISCSGDYEGIGNDSSSKPQNEVKSIVISFPAGNFDINKDIVFTATSDANEDITSFCEFFVNDTKITGNKFKSASPGDFTVYCKYNSIKSNTSTFKIVDASAKPITFTTNVLVEDITGTWCGYCPRVAYKLQELQKKTSQLVVVAAHSGSTNSLDYEKVDVLKSTFGVAGFPWGILNRKGTGDAGRWGEGDAQITSIAASPSKAGVAIESSITGRDLTVKIKAKFSEDYTGLKYVIYLLENDLKATQRTYGDLGYGIGTEIPSGSDKWWLVDFEHKHVLRKALTSGPLGDAIDDSSSKKGSIFEKSHTYTIPAAYNKDKMEIVAFVVKSDKSVLNARYSEFGKTQSFQEISN